jgi:hypothetical protein
MGTIAGCAQSLASGVPCAGRPRAASRAKCLLGGALGSIRRPAGRLARGFSARILQCDGLLAVGQLAVTASRGTAARTPVGGAGSGRRGVHVGVAPSFLRSLERCIQVLSCPSDPTTDQASLAERCSVGAWHQPGSGRSFLARWCGHLGFAPIEQLPQGPLHPGRGPGQRVVGVVSHLLDHHARLAAHDRFDPADGVEAIARAVDILEANRQPLDPWGHGAQGSTQRGPSSAFDFEVGRAGPNGERCIANTRPATERLAAPGGAPGKAGHVTGPSSGPQRSGFETRPTRARSQRRVSRHQAHPSACPLSWRWWSRW